MLTMSSRPPALAGTVKPNDPMTSRSCQIRAQTVPGKRICAGQEDCMTGLEIARRRELPRGFESHTLRSVNSPDLDRGRGGLVDSCGLRALVGGHALPSAASDIAFLLG